MKLLYLLILCSLFLVQGCRDKPDPDCIPDPIPNDYVEPQNAWMIRHEIGDTLLFNRYHVDTTADGTRKYRYTGQEQYIATDTGTVKIVDETTPYHDGDCNIYINRLLPTLYFKGKRKLQVQLKPQGSFDWLCIYFNSKEFRIDNDQYNYPSRTFNFAIEGKEFKKVNYIIGFPEGSWAKAETYTDSTYAFYNYDYGILKFIINDTLVFQRVISK